MSRFLSLSIILFSATAPAFGLEVRVPDAETQNRFASGFPGDPVPNASENFLLNGYDLSGIGWTQSNANRGIIMVSPLHFIAATHYRPAASDSIVFENGSGNLVSIGVNDTTTMTNDNGSGSDLTLGTLDRALTASDEVGFFPVANLGPEAAYIGSQLLVYGTTPRVGTGTLGSFQDFASDPVTAGSGLNPSRTYQFTYNNLAGGANDAYFEVGDSGSPSFIETDGQLAITGIHSALVDSGSTRTNYDTFVPHYEDELNAAMANDPGSYQLSQVPEPSALSLLLGACALLTVTVRRRA